MITVKFTTSHESNWDVLESTLVPLLKTNIYLIQQVYSNSYELFIVRPGRGNDQEAILKALQNIPGVDSAYMTPGRNPQ